MYQGNACNHSVEGKQKSHPVQGIYYPQQLAYQNEMSKEGNDSTKSKIAHFSNNNLRNISTRRGMTRPASIAALSNSSFSFSSSQDISSHYVGTNINIPKNKISSKGNLPNSVCENNLKYPKEIQQLSTDMSNNKSKIKSSTEDEITKPNIIMRNKKSNSNVCGKEKVKKDRISSWRVSRFLPSKLANSFSNSMHCKF
uniref:Uncharacterized protein n=1 Tax=Strongyloides papillosus TaxID=174720 RepID=A0A0N5BYM7_STREA